MIPSPKPVDLEEYLKGNNAEFQTKYGLPEEVRFLFDLCCFQSAAEFDDRTQTWRRYKESDHSFDSANKCDACHAANDKNATDWDAREAELVELCDRFRRDDGHYDCLVPGSGGKDSFYTAHVLKHKYNMNPLTITWAPHIYTDWGWKNFQAWMHAGLTTFCSRQRPGSPVADAPCCRDPLSSVPAVHSWAEEPRAGDVDTVRHSLRCLW